MNTYAIFGFFLGLYNVVGYFCAPPKQLKLAIASLATFLTIIPATISLAWAIYELWEHPFSKLKYVCFGLAKYFLADAFQDIIDHVSIAENNRLAGTASKTNRFYALFRHLLHSDPLTRSYKYIYYSYAHVIYRDDEYLQGGQGDQGVSNKMRIEGAYDYAISIGGHRLCIVDMSKIGEKEEFYSGWGERVRYCLHFDGGRFEKHTILNDEAAKVVNTMIAWWSASPEKPVLWEYDKESKTAKCPSLYRLYCFIDNEIVDRGKHEVVDIGHYVHIA